MADDVASAAELYRESIDALGRQREQIAEDLAFSDPSDPQQWDSQARVQREKDPGGARPCLVFDQLGQYCANVAGQIEQSPPGLHAMPVGGGADKRTAEQLDGHFRHIEHSSRAMQHYALAGTTAARAGVGYLIVRPEYVDANLGYQEPRISAEGDPLRVVLDPWSVDLAGRDAEFGFRLQPFSRREFARRWPKADLLSFGDELRDTRRTDERESIVVAECWTTEESTVNLVTYMDVRGEDATLPEADYWLAHQRGEVAYVLESRKEKRKQVWWRRMSGAEVLDKSVDQDGKEQPFPADGIGIVPVYGYIGFADGRMTYCGIPRRARAAQQAYNYHMSEARAYTGTAPKSPWVVSHRAIRGFERLWDRASVDARAYLPYNDIDEEGAIAAPQRMSVSADLRNHIQGADQALRDIQASIGMYQANLGAPSNETSGVAIDARKEQGENSTAHFQTHLAASVARVGELSLQMIQRLCDTKRQMRILSIDEQPSTITLDPQQPAAINDEGGISINPNVGRYDVRVVVGAAYSTQRSQAQQAFTEMMRANPAMAPAIAPLWAQVLDVPHADKMAQILTAMAPPEVRAILNPEAQTSTPQLQAKVQELSQALQEAIQHARDAQQEADEAKAELQRQEADAEGRERELNIKAYDAETKRAQVLAAAITPDQVQAMVLQTIQQMMARPDPLPPEAYEQAGPNSYEMQTFPAAMNMPQGGAEGYT